MTIPCTWFNQLCYYRVHLPRSLILFRQCLANGKLGSLLWNAGINLQALNSNCPWYSWGGSFRCHPLCTRQLHTFPHGIFWHLQKEAFYEGLLAAGIWCCCLYSFTAPGEENDSTFTNSSALIRLFFVTFTSRFRYEAQLRLLRIPTHVNLDRSG